MPVKIANVFDYQAKVREVPNRNGPILLQNFLIWLTLFGKWLDVILENWKLKAKQCAVYDRAYYYNNDETSGVSDEFLATLSPYERIPFFEDFLENGFNIDRELFQREVHKICIAILAHLIVGPEWKFVAQKIVKQRGWEQFIKSLSLFAMAFRRAGKTSLVQQIVAALLIWVFGVSVAIFATSKRISKVLGKGVMKMIIEAGHEDMIFTNSDELITLRINKKQIGERELFMSPGNPDIYILSALWFNF